MICYFKFFGRATLIIFDIVKSNNDNPNVNIERISFISVDLKNVMYVGKIIKYTMLHIVIKIQLFL